MSQTQVTRNVVKYTAQRVTLSTSKSTKDVVAALDEELNKDACTGGAVVRLLATANSKEEIDSGMGQLLDNGKRDFVLFSASSHSKWLNTYCADSKSREFTASYNYTLGNPLIAQTIMQRDLAAGLHIPPRILVQSLEDGQGTRILYDLPSSTMLIGDEVDPDLRKAVEGLDVKLERMLRKVMAS